MDEFIKETSKPKKQVIIGKIKSNRRVKQSSDWQDVIPNLVLKLGVTYSRQGVPVWTTFKTYAYEPTFEHPFTIKIQMANAAAVEPVFTQMPPEQFKTEFMEPLNKWWDSIQENLKTACEQEKELEIKRNTFEHIKSLMQDPNTNPYDLIQEPHIIDKYQFLYKKCIDLIDRFFATDKNTLRTIYYNEIRKLINKLLTEEELLQKIITHLNESIENAKDISNITNRHITDSFFFNDNVTIEDLLGL